MLGVNHPHSICPPQVLPSTCISVVFFQQICLGEKTCNCYLLLHMKGQGILCLFSKHIDSNQQQWASNNSATINQEILYNTIALLPGSMPQHCLNKISGVQRMFDC